MKGKNVYIVIHFLKGNSLRNLGNILGPFHINMSLQILAYFIGSGVISSIKASFLSRDTVGTKDTVISSIFYGDLGAYVKG